MDPDYLDNGHIWLYYTPLEAPIRNRLSRFTNVDDQLLNEEIILEGPEVSTNIHNGGCLAFAMDKTLFLGMGEDAQGSGTAQNLFDLRGKILHIQRDGTPAPDNPFADGVEGDPRVWALGFRNPYRCSLLPVQNITGSHIFYADFVFHRYRLQHSQQILE